MGSVFLRGRIWWIVYWRNGERFRESSKSEVREDALDLLKRHNGEIGRRPARTSLSALFDLVLDDYRENGRTSYEDVEQRIRLHLKPVFGDVRVDQLTTTAVRRFIRSRQVQKAANATINRELAVLSRALHLGLEHEPPLVGRLVKIRRLREDNVRAGFVDDLQYRALLRELPDYLKLVLVIAYHTGARKGELLSLRWNQVDLKAKQIRLNAGETKNREGRVLPIYGDMAPFLEMQRARQAKAERLQRIAHGAKQPARHSQPAANRSIFTDPDGRLILSFYKAWAAACDRAKIPGQLFHDLRRSAVRNMERAGIPRGIGMQISGHLTEAVYRRYAIVNDRDVMDAGRKLEAAMAGKKETPQNIPNPSVLKGLGRPQ